MRQRMLLALTTGSSSSSDAKVESITRLSNQKCSRTSTTADMQLPCDEEKDKLGRIATNTNGTATSANQTVVTSTLSYNNGATTAAVRLPYDALTVIDSTVISSTAVPAVVPLPQAMIAPAVTKSTTVSQNGAGADSMEDPLRNNYYRYRDTDPNVLLSRYPSFRLPPPPPFLISFRLSK